MELHQKTLYELLHGKLLSDSHIKSFGYLVYVHGHDLTKDKFWARSCVFFLLFIFIFF